MTTPNTVENNSATQKNDVAILQKDITEEVLGKIKTLKADGLQLPASYVPANALKSAFFKLQEVVTREGKPCLSVCSKASIANSLLNMTIQGLNPAKTQCYFIAYGDKLEMQRSYFGTQLVMKRLSNVENIWANVIYQGDKFVYGNEEGRDVLISHESSLENRDNPILGAYAIVKEKDGSMPMTVMSKKEIETSWTQGKTDKIQKKFPQEMAKRTVINRAAKNYVNTSDDSDILVESINQTTNNEFEDDRIDKNSAMDVEYEVRENANKEVFISTAEPKKEKQNPIDEQHPNTVDKPTGTINDNVDGQPNWTL